MLFLISFKNITLLRNGRLDMKFFVISFKKTVSLHFGLAFKIDVSLHFLRLLSFLFLIIIFGVKRITIYWDFTLTDELLFNIVTLNIGYILNLQTIVIVFQILLKLTDSEVLYILKHIIIYFVDYESEMNDVPSS